LEKKVRLFSKHCEEVEQKKFDLEQWKQRQQKFETRQEYRLSDWNSN
jgi:hypothetical protein